MLLVADALTGQDAVNLARSFNERVGLTGIVLTRVDGDGRGGAALSMRAVTGQPIKLIGTGEKLDALEDFDPARIAGRILGMGDIVALVEKARTTIDAEKAARAVERMRKGAFDLSDLREQLTQMQNMGGMSGLMAMLPGVAKIKNQIAERNLDEKLLKRQMAIIDFNDAAGAAQSGCVESKPQAAYRRRLRHQARGHQSPLENAPHHGRRDEGDGGRRQARADGRACRHARLWRRSWRRHAQRGRDGEACGENAGRAPGGNAGCGRGRPAAEFSRSAGCAAERTRRTWAEAPGGLPPGFPGFGKKK